MHSFSYQQNAIRTVSNSSEILNEEKETLSRNSKKMNWKYAKWNYVFQCLVYMRMNSFCNIMANRFKSCSRRKGNWKLLFNFNSLYVYLLTSTNVLQGWSVTWVISNIVCCVSRRSSKIFHLLRNWLDPTTK